MCKVENSDCGYSLIHTEGLVSLNSAISLPPHVTFAVDESSVLGRSSFKSHIEFIE